MDKKWYVIRATVSREEKALKNLLYAIEDSNCASDFGRAIIPIEHITEVKNGEKHVVKRKLYSGYVLVEMDITESSFMVIMETKGLGGFVGSDRKTPTALSPKEVSRVLEAMEVSEKPKLKIEYDVGETVTISSGPFEGYTGIIEEIYPEKGLLKMNVSIFGRQTPVELEYWQIERN